MLFVEPTYAMYRFYSELAGAQIVAPRYDRCNVFPVEQVLRALRPAPRVFFLPNPNSPTGNLLSLGTVAADIESGAAHDGRDRRGLLRIFGVYR